METAEEFATALEAARDEAGALSYKKVERALWDRLGAYAPTDETLRRYHRGRVEPEAADPLVVLVLAEVYDKPVRELSPTVADRLEGVRDLVATFLWISDSLISTRPQARLFDPDLIHPAA
jgi:hypothetical protein